MATRAEDITKWLNELVPIVEKLNMALLQDRVSYEMIRGDVQATLAQKAKAFEELKTIQDEIDRAKGVAEKIVQDAQAAAKEIVNQAKTIKVEALKTKQDADEYVKRMDRRVNERVMEAASKIK